jgi:hypothetical protein
MITNFKIYEGDTFNSIANIIDEYNQFIKNVSPFIESKLGKDFYYFEIIKIQRLSNNKFEFSVKTFDDSNEVIAIHYILVNEGEMNDVFLKINANKYNL